MVPRWFPAASGPGQLTRPRGSSGSRQARRTRKARGSPPIRRPASGGRDRCARKGARRGAWTASTGGTDSRPHPNRLPPALAGDVLFQPGILSPSRGHFLPAGDIRRVRGHFLPAGDVLRVGERDCCPRRRRMPPAGTRRARPCGMSPGAGRCEAGRCRRGDVRVLRGTQGRVSRIWCQGTPPWWEADRPSSTKPRRA